MPVLYEDEGVLKEHLHCRTHASLFDVSHMGQVSLTGPDRLKFIERVSVGDIKSTFLTNSAKSKGMIHQSYLSMFLNHHGGIIDDTIITNFPEKDEVKLVVNGANKYKVMDHFKAVKDSEKLDVKFKLDDTRSLICIQGPKAAQVVEAVLKIPTEDIPFMSQFEFTNQTYTVPLYVARSGYTGEDGFEISFDNKYTNTIVNAFLQQPDVKFAGLGARDSLRIEAGLCLHGHDINDKTTPFEANLMWTVSKKKEGRTPFIGKEALDKQIADNKAKKTKLKKRVGFMLENAGVVREGATILTKQGENVGKVSSGTFSPVLKKGLGMMYVDQDHCKEDTPLTA